MTVSNDLISKFAKMSKEAKLQKETTVFGTTMEFEDNIYVRIDGSDMLTPISTTSEIGAGERVTVLVKDHTATVTGNITNPSASKKTTDSLETHFDDGGTVTVLTEQVSSLEQFASQFTMEFFEKIENADRSVTELLSYINFDFEGITIGQEGYPIRLKLTKDRIKFIDNSDVELAYFSDGKLYVTNAEILDTFKIGNYGFMTTANGGLTIGTLN